MSLRNFYISLEHFNCLSGLQEILFYYFPNFIFLHAVANGAYRVEYTAYIYMASIRSFVSRSDYST